MNKRELKNIIDTMKNNGCYELNVSRSNKKLVPTETTGFIIWNLPAIITCPYATAMCKAVCYARKAEQAYPDCLPSRMRNLQETRKESFPDNMIYTIYKAVYYTPKKVLIVRIHESGDFYNKKYVADWLKIILACKVFDGKKYPVRVKFIAYTKSFPFFDGVKIPANFSLRASLFADTSEKQKALIKKNDWPIYTAVDKFQKGDKFTRCRCADCATCGKCWSKRKDIRCEIH